MLGGALGEDAALQLAGIEEPGVDPAAPAPLRVQHHHLVPIEAGGAQQPGGLASRGERLGILIAIEQRQQLHQLVAVGGHAHPCLEQRRNSSI